MLRVQLTILSELVADGLATTPSGAVLRARDLLGRVTSLAPGEKIVLSAHHCEGYEVTADGVRVALCDAQGGPDHPLPRDVQEILPMREEQHELVYIAKDRKRYLIRRA